MKNIINSKNKNDTFYHLSPKNHIKILIPKISTKGVPSFEDTTTKRICFTSSIDGCLKALMPVNGECLFVYVPNETKQKFQPYYPFIKEVTDCKETGEVWSFTKTPVLCIGKIQVEKEIKVERKKNYKGTFCIIHYEWKWIEQKEESAYELSM